MNRSKRAKAERESEAPAGGGGGQREGQIYEQPPLLTPARASGQPGPLSCAAPARVVEPDQHIVWRVDQLPLRVVEPGQPLRRRRGIRKGALGHVSMVTSTVTGPMPMAMAEGERAEGWNARKSCARRRGNPTAPWDGANADDDGGGGGRRVQMPRERACGEETSP